MYDSLIMSCENVTLYAIAFDRATYDVLRELDLSKMVVIPYREFEDDTLREAKSNRSLREFLWTCSGYSIRYLINRFNLPDLTYIDSDLYFYESPEPVIQRFLKSDCDVAIISHRYSNNPENDYASRTCGKYCVEFNSFKNTPNGLAILEWWVNKCIDKCPEIPADELFGDQKYLDQFELFKGVYVYMDFGLGIAPWNIDDYSKQSELIENKQTHEIGKPVFYHFHSLDISQDGTANIRVYIRPGRHDSSLVDSIYKPYIRKIVEKRQLLKRKFGLFKSAQCAEHPQSRLSVLRSFLTEEPNLLFLFRKIWRYLLYKRKDYIRV